eukprot:Gregarina_sp_Poly_1__460@NODE_110_length_13975_cov_113_221887_g97_i0_p1_GENE_NODE_110_length_13975_cov_113_221887_g97_i0NODE_110_length_13975_cov_113_221887_g97_i0_p1_ORF_typecomplete_len912_score140_30tRNAsynt_His/PF13393_6/3_6e99HGTP_anticodon/PF03129_20/1_2e04HGTP_anticodon/PF03129_20/1_8e11HGTP_anticodon2/PF12745_7/6_3e08tRNAsynt_2/PF00152_20/0_2tRNAsynt_2/PF00152_20/31_NODE_110_length_13975_cov_113_221887_g97_i01119313928
MPSPCVSVGKGVVGLELCVDFIQACDTCVVFDESIRAKVPDTDDVKAAVSKKQFNWNREWTTEEASNRLQKLLILSFMVRSASSTDTATGPILLSVCETLRKSISFDLEDSVQSIGSLGAWFESKVGAVPKSDLANRSQLDSIKKRLTAQPFQAIADALIAIDLSKRFSDQLLVEAALMVELLALPVDGLLSCVGPQCSDEALKFRAHSVHWLFEDSKIQMRSKDLKTSEDLCLFLCLLGRLDVQLKNLERECRNQLDQQVCGEASLSLRQELINWKLSQCLQTWCKIFSTIAVIFQAAVDSKLQETPLPCESPPPDLPSEATYFYETFIREPVSSVISGAVFVLPLETHSALKPHEVLRAVFRSVDNFHRASQFCLQQNRVELWNVNCKKIGNKKKNVNWSLKFGRGLEEFAIFAKIPNDFPFAEILMSKNQAGRKPKTPKGCLDFEPAQMRLREVVFDHIKSIFKLYGAEPIDTPIFELKEVLTGKYGEDQKLIYDLKDQGGEQLGLRYDLTVPFARFCASNNIEKIRRYHIGKVYRRDEPQVARGRLREFYQCDIDIAGSYDCMTPEAEILSMLVHLFKSLKPIVGNFKIKLSHRAFLDGMMSLAGVPQDKFRAISSAVDKLDKESWEIVEEEMCGAKGLARDAAERLRRFLTLSGSYFEVKRKFQAIEGVNDNAQLQLAIKELDTLFDLLEYMPHVGELIIFDTSLARGLDYYTGLIYEVVLVDGEVPVGTIAAGGRYDGLIGLFSAKPIPAAGVSVGIERVLRLLDSRFDVDKYKIASKHDRAQFAYTNKSDVFIINAGEGLLKEKLEIATKLRQAGIRVEFGLQGKLKLAKQIPHILETHIPIGIIVGDAELKSGVLKIRQYFENKNGEEIAVPVGDLVDTVQMLLRVRNDGSQKLGELLFCGVG